MTVAFRQVDARRTAFIAVALALLAVAAWLRLRMAFVHPLWLDEAYSAYAAGKGWHFLWTVVPQYETHPPFYYSLLRLWTLAFGDGRDALRALGVAASLASLPGIALAGREIARVAGWGKAAVPLAAMLLGALAPFPLAMAHEVRPYPVMILAYAVAAFALLRLGREAAEGRGVRPRPLALYGVTLALMLWLHNLGVLYAVAMTLALAVLVLRRSLTRGDWLRLAACHVLVALLYLPALLILIDQAPTWVRSTWLRFSTEALQWRLAALYARPTGTVAAIVTLLVLLAAVALGRSGAGRRAGAALLLLAFVPVGLSIIVSMQVAPVFIPRTMAAAVVPFLLLLAGASGGGPWARWPACGLIGLLAWQMAAADLRAIPGRPQQDWYPAMRWLAGRYRPGDLVVAYPNEGALPFAYAARDLGLAMPVRPVPTPVPSIGIPGGWYPTGSRGVVSLPRPALRRIAAAPDLRAVPTVWLLRLGPWAYDKGDVFLKEVGRGRAPVGRYRRGPIDIAGLRRVDRP